VSFTIVEYLSTNADSLSGRRIYPPHSIDQLHDLHGRILAAPIAQHYKQSLLFYLLKDLAFPRHEVPDIADSFARNVHLPRRFWTFIEGLWALDHLQFETAVGNLTHPSIIPTFPDEILAALLHRKTYPEELEGGDVLPLTYYNCVKPPLADEHIKVDFVRYLADRNVTETYYWIHARPSSDHRPLLEVLIESTLRSGTGGAAGDEPYPRQDKAMELVGLPLTEEEEGWLESYLTEGNGRNFRNAMDTVLVRRLATGKLSEVTGETRFKAKTVEGVNWDMLRDGVERGVGPRKEEENTFMA
jgi:hypothetical protein